MYNKKLIIVYESYTYCKCDRCWNIKEQKLEIYNCDECGLVIDRDRNLVFLINIFLNIDNGLLVDVISSLKNF